MPRFDVTTIGEGQLRYSVAAGKRLEHVSQFDVQVSGTEANVTGLLSRLGWSCGWVSSLPDTPLGRRVRNEYQLTGLDLSKVQWSKKHRLATYYVEYAVAPRATQVYYDRANTCFSNMTSNDIDWDYLLDTRILHISGLSLALSTSVKDLLVEAIERAKDANLKISFDMNYRSRLWSVEKAAEIVKPLLSQVDILFFSRNDAKQLFGFEGTVKDTLEQIKSITSADKIITTLSADGLIAWDGKDFQTTAAREVTILDRIGAGDALVGGVLHGYLQNNFNKGLHYGVTCAAMALSQFGDQLITNYDELEQVLNAPQVDIAR